MTKYRIVYNGIDYRIQWLGKTLILRRPKWHWLLHYSYAGSWIQEFDSIEKAQVVKQSMIRFDKAKKRGYIEI